MATTLFVAIKDEAQKIQELYRGWRSDYREDINCGTIKILQLAIDMTGYHYVLTLEDVTNIENIQIAVCEKILKSLLVQKYEDNILSISQHKEKVSNSK